MEDSIKEKLKHEIVGILLIAVAVFLFLSLASYDPNDPSFFSYSSSKVKVIHNWMGVVGPISPASCSKASAILVF